MVQWGYEYRPFKYQKYLNTELFEVLICMGSMTMSLCSLTGVVMSDSWMDLSIIYCTYSPVTINK